MYNCVFDLMISEMFFFDYCLKTPLLKFTGTTFRFVFIFYQKYAYRHEIKNIEEE